MSQHTVVAEVESEWGGTYALARIADASAGRELDRDRYELTLRERDDERAARIAAVVGAVLGGACAGSLAILMLPEHGAPDGLTPVRGEQWPVALAVGGVLGGLFGAVLGYFLGAPFSRLREDPIRLAVIFGETVLLDGQDSGRLKSIESHPASSIVLIVTERATLRIPLADTRGAAELASLLERVRDSDRA